MVLAKWAKDTLIYFEEDIKDNNIEKTKRINLLLKAEINEAIFKINSLLERNSNLYIIQTQTID